MNPKHVFSLLSFDYYTFTTIIEGCN